MVLIAWLTQLLEILGACCRKGHCGFCLALSSQDPVAFVIGSLSLLLPALKLLSIGRPPSTRAVHIIWKATGLSICSAQAWLCQGWSSMADAATGVSEARGSRILTATPLHSAGTAALSSAGRTDSLSLFLSITCLSGLHSMTRHHLQWPSAF